MKRLFTPASEELHRKVKARAAEEGQNVTGWVKSAIVEKLGKAGRAQAEPENPMVDLTDEARRKAAKRYIRFLKTCPSEFMEAVEEITRSMERLQRQVCRRSQPPR